MNKMEINLKIPEGYKIIKREKEVDICTSPVKTDNRKKEPPMVE